ncbi:MAG: hypothetical protein DHS20C21_09800 [Gemmatimonadota bacterium]|nr:MAG: hypothetical protein DHS20C21_09800 [Gemmatimonadota bacterium]
MNQINETPATRWVVLAALCLASLTVGCGTSAQLVDMWRDSSYEGAPLENVLVVALARDRLERRVMEDSFVASFGEQGATVTASYQRFPDAPPRPDALKELAAEGECGGVLVLIRAGRDEKEVYVPGYTEKKKVVDYKHWGEYEEHLEVIHHEGYTETQVVVRMKGDLLAGKDGRLLWTGTSEVVDPTSREEFRNAVAKTFSRELLEAELVGRPAS